MVGRRQRAWLLLREVGRKSSLSSVTLHPALLAPNAGTVYSDSIVYHEVMSSHQGGTMNSHKLIIRQSLSVRYLHEYPAASLG